MKNQTWNELRDAIDRMTPEQREQEIKARGESIPLSGALLITADEDMYFDTEYFDEGCFGKSELSAQEFEEIKDRIELICTKGMPYIWIGAQWQAAKTNL